MLQQRFTGGMVEVIGNAKSLYEGDMVHYTRFVFGAPNIHMGYHNLRHMFHVPWFCYQAISYYDMLGRMTTRSRRNLMIGSFMHDYDHGGYSDDRLNVERAVRGMRSVLLPEDVGYADDIEQIMWATLYPHADLGRRATDEEEIIRDADISQAFSPAWIGQILGGLGEERGKTPIEMLQKQREFLRSVRFLSDYGKVFYGEAAVAEKLAETESLIALLDARD